MYVEAFLAVDNNAGVLQNGKVFADGGPVAIEPLCDFTDTSLSFGEPFHDGQPHRMRHGLENLNLLL
jgi:hypothetical protein